MHLPSTLLSLALVLLAETRPVSAQATTAPNPKRGLCFTPDDKWPKDNYVWTRPPTTLTWYYNYHSKPSPQFSNLTQEAFEFVPMMWGAPGDLSDTTWLNEVRAVIASGVNITHVMGFNEPDGLPQWGSSNISPAVAAEVWVRNIIPLQETGIKAGLPAPTGGWGGVPWLRQFLGNCSAIVSKGLDSPKNCTYDFVPIHWYGSFDGLASHIGTYAAAFPGKKIWVTEWNFDNQALDATQQFVRMSLEYMDRIDDVERYSIFGAFRSIASNVGPNAAMLSAGGGLTEIGAMYLGKNISAAVPPDSAARRQTIGHVFALGAAMACAVVLFIF